LELINFKEPPLPTKNVVICWVLMFFYAIYNFKVHYMIWMYYLADKFETKNIKDYVIDIREKINIFELLKDE